MFSKLLPSTLTRVATRGPLRSRLAVALGSSCNVVVPTPITSGPGLGSRWYSLPPLPDLNVPNYTFATGTTLAAKQTSATEIYGDMPFLGTKREGVYQYISYKEFDQVVKRFVSALHDAGVRPGDRVGIIGNNSVEWAAGAYATYHLRAVWVPMYEQQLTKDWKYILNDSSPRLLFVSKGGLLPRATEAIEGTSVEKIVSLDNSPSHEGIIDFLDAGKTSFADVKKAIGETTKDDLATLIYTSGTTGEPKGVMLTHENIVWIMEAADRVVPLSLAREGEDRSLCFLPWAHVYGQVMELHQGLAVGGCLGLAESIETLQQNFLDVQPTVLVGVPQVFIKIYDGVKTQVAQLSLIKRGIFSLAVAIAQKRNRLLSQGKTSAVNAKLYNLMKKVVFKPILSKLGGRLKLAILGGAPLSREVQDFFTQLGIEIVEGYGLTETSPIIAMERLAPTKDLQGGLRPPPGVDMKIANPDTLKFCGDNEEGEIWAAGPHVMKGYYNKPQATAEAFVVGENGVKYFRTGDLGKVDETGALRITGRLKEQYKLGNGKFVAPDPVEGAMKTSRFVFQAFLHGIGRQYNVALVVPDKEAIKEWAHYKHVKLPEGFDSYEGDYYPPDEFKVIYDLINREMKRKVAPHVKSYEVPQKFLVLTKEFTVADGLLTPKLSMKRNVIANRFKEAIESLYETEDA